MEVPLHYRIYLEIRKEIEEGRLAYGDLVPSETELQERYGVSRAPVRQALSRLGNELYVEKKQGKGTFVKYCLGRGPWYAVGGLGEDYKRDWDRQKSVTLSVDFTTPPSAFQKKKIFLKEHEVIHLRRLRYIDNVPIYYMNQFIPGDFDIEKIRAEGDFLTIRELLFKLFAVAVCDIYEEVSAVTPPPDVAEALRIPGEKPLLEIETVAYDKEMRVAYCDIDYVNSDYWKYKSKRSELSLPRSL